MANRFDNSDDQFLRAMEDMMEGQLGRPLEDEEKGQIAAGYLGALESITSEVFSDGDIGVALHEQYMQQQNNALSMLEKSLYPQDKLEELVQAIQQALNDAYAMEANYAFDIRDIRTQERKKIRSKTDTIVEIMQSHGDQNGVQQFESALKLARKAGVRTNIDSNP